MGKMMENLKIMINKKDKIISKDNKMIILNNN